MYFVFKIPCVEPDWSDTQNTNVQHDKQGLLK